MPQVKPSRGRRKMAKTARKELHLLLLGNQRVR
jgi:hypothetical protein